MKTFHSLSLVAIATTMVACAQMDATTQALGRKATAPLVAKSGSSVAGVISFQQAGQGVIVSGSLTGLKPNQEHGFHVHDKGDCSSADGMSAAGHFNPNGKPHGHHTGAAKHAGDMPNLKADASGVAKFEYKLNGLTVDAGPTSVVGRGLIVHANPDDYTSQPVGNAGGRLACGVIVSAK